MFLLSLEIYDKMRSKKPFWRTTVGFLQRSAELTFAPAAKSQA